jgi:hypothetical protein
MRNLFAFIALCLFFTGCGPIRETIMEKKVEVPVVLPVKPVHGSVSAVMSDSTIEGKKMSGHDTVAKITTHFNIADSIKNNTAKVANTKERLKKALNELNSLPVEAVVDYYVKPDSARGKVTLTERTTERVQELGWFDYLKIGSVFFIFGVIFGLFIKR